MTIMLAHATPEVPHSLNSLLIPSLWYKYILVLCLHIHVYYDHILLERAVEAQELRLLVTD